MLGPGSDRGRTRLRPRTDPALTPVRPRSDPHPTPVRPRSDPEQADGHLHAVADEAQVAADGDAAVADGISHLLDARRAGAEPRRQHTRVDVHQPAHRLVVSPQRRRRRPGHARHDAHHHLNPADAHRAQPLRGDALHAQRPQPPRHDRVHAHAISHAPWQPAGPLAPNAPTAPAPRAAPPDAPSARDPHPA